MPPNARANLAQTGIDAARDAVLADLVRRGLLLKQDKRLPSAITLLAGAPLASSWWSHPQGRLFFRVLQALAEHPDLLLTKLLHGKDTFVHRSLWPELLTLAGAGEPWQSAGLPAPARRLLQRVQQADTPLHASGTAARELQSRLLVHALEVHTGSGRHALALQPWAAWATQKAVTPAGSLTRSRAQLEAATRALGATPAALPWPPAPPA
ncbi:MAG TPA: hypothetical protein VET66_04000 [Steroidobacteraceae bacterium]|nr:hypothetical protein [Steroidobacteraceae bacterium]